MISFLSILSRQLMMRCNIHIRYIVGHHLHLFLYLPNITLRISNRTLIGNELLLALISSDVPPQLPKNILLLLPLLLYLLIGLEDLRLNLLHLLLIVRVLL